MALSWLHDTWASTHMHGGSLWTTSQLCFLLGRGLVSVCVFLCMYLSLIFTISSVFKSDLDYHFSVSLALVASVFSLVFPEDERILVSFWECSYGNSWAKVSVYKCTAVYECLMDHKSGKSGILFYFNQKILTILKQRIVLMKNKYFKYFLLTLKLKTVLF